MSAAPAPPDTFKCRKTLKVGGKTYEYFSLPDAEKNGLGGLSKLPFSLKVLVGEPAALRGRPLGDGGRHPRRGRLAEGQDLHARDRLSARRACCMQDFTGVPARRRPRRHARRHEVARRRSRQDQPAGARSTSSSTTRCMVDFFGTADAFEQNVEIEYERNKERYEFLRWGAERLQQLPASCRPAPASATRSTSSTWRRRCGRGRSAARCQAYPDTCVGTDSHTTMVNGAGRAGLGRRRHRGGSGHAGPAGRHGHPRGRSASASRASSRKASPPPTSCSPARRC